MTDPALSCSAWGRPWELMRGVPRGGKRFTHHVDEDVVLGAQWEASVLHGGYASHSR